MATKNGNEITYGGSALPQGERRYSIIRWGWSGLNKTDKFDTGQMTDADGVIADPPGIYPMRDMRLWIDANLGLHPADDTSVFHDATPISIHGIENRLYMVWRDEYDAQNLRFRVSLFRVTPHSSIQTGIALGNATGSDEEDLIPRSLIQFNVVDTSSGNVAAFRFFPKVLVYPDCYSFDLVPDVNADYFAGDDPGTVPPTPRQVPMIRKAAVYGSRVFGVDMDAVYASVYNSYVDYSLDTADDISAAHAWMSLSQSDTKANNAFTAIATYDNHVVLFKKDFMQLVYNNKNPFRIVDVGEYGCDSQKAVCEMNGALYFASRDAVYVYTGGTPKVVSKNLGIDDFSGSVLGAFKDTLYLFRAGILYAYKNGQWTCLGRPQVNGKDVWIEQFAALDYGLCALVKGIGTQKAFENKRVYFIDWAEDAAEAATGEDFTPTYGDDWWFESDFLLRASGGLLNVRRAKKLTVLCEGREDATVSVYLLTDDETFDASTANKVGELTFTEDGIKEMRVLTRQFSGWAHRLRFAGHGYVRIYAAELQISWGGDVYEEG